MKHLIVIIITALLSAKNIQAQYFMKYFGGNLDERAAGMVMDQDKIWFGGHSNDNLAQEYDIHMIKTDLFGNLHWEKQYYYPGFQLVNSIFRDNSGDLFIAGETGSFGSNSGAFLMKTDSAGNQIWYQTYSGFGVTQAKSMNVNPDGTIMIIGFQSDSTGSNDIWLAKLDASGNMIWEQKYGGRDNDYGMNVFDIPGGDYMITGDTRSNSIGGYDIYAARIGPLGNVIWNILLGDSLNNGCQGAIKCNDGSILIYGETEVYSGSPFNYYFTKIDTSGNVLWTNTQGGLGSDAAFTAVEINGGYVFGGYSNSDNPGSPVRAVLCKTDLSGNILSEVVHGAGGIHIIYSIYDVPGIGLFSGGSSTLNGNDVFLIHSDFNGLVAVPSILTEHRTDIYPNPATESFRIKDLKRDDLVRIYDVYGKCQFHVKVDSNEEISPKLKNGYYLVHILSVTRNYSLPLIINDHQ